MAKHTAHTTPRQDYESLPPSQALMDIMIKFTAKSRELRKRGAQVRADLRNLDAVSLSDTDKAETESLLVEMLDSIADQMEKLTKETAVELTRQMEIDRNPPPPEITPTLEAAPYYPAPHTRQIKEFCELLFNPGMAEERVQTVKDEDTNKDIQRPIYTTDTHSLARTGQRVEIIWYQGKIAAEGIMLVQYLRRLWMQQYGNRKPEFLRGELPRLLVLNVREYAKARKSDNFSRTKTQIMDEIKKLVALQFSYYQGDKYTGGTHFLSANLQQTDNDPDNDIIQIYLDDDVAAWFRDAARKFVFYPEKLFKINLGHNPLAWNLGQYLAEQKSYLWKRGDKFLMIRPAEMIAACRILETRQITKHKKQEIIIPIERDLNALGDIYPWEYSTGGRVWAGNYISWMKTAVFNIQYTNNPYDKIDVEARKLADKKRRDAMRSFSPPREKKWKTRNKKRQ